MKICQRPALDEQRPAGRARRDSTLPALQPGSSIMPGKVNPVIPEAVAMVAAQVMGHDAAIAIAGQSGNFQLNVMLPLIASNLLESIRLLANAACRARRPVPSRAPSRMWRVSTKRWRAIRFLATALNPVIGYERAAAIAKRAYAEGRPVFDVALEMSGLERRRIATPARSGGADARWTARRRRPRLRERALSAVSCASGSCGVSKVRSRSHELADWRMLGVDAERSRRLQRHFPADPVAAAVLVALVDRPEGLTVLLTQRASQLANHAAQISFPGGRLEDIRCRRRRAPRCAKRRKKSVSIRRACASSAIYPITWSSAAFA